MLKNTSERKKRLSAALPIVSIVLAIAVAIVLGRISRLPTGTLSFAVALFTGSIVVGRSLLWGGARNLDPARFRGTKQMAARLRELDRAKDVDAVYQIFSPLGAIFPINRYFSTKRNPRRIRSKVGVWMREAELLFVGGETQEAIDLFLRVKELAETNRSAFDEKFFRVLKDSMAIAYLRLGEQRNCIARHTADSCIVPIRDSGVHTIQEPSRAAIELYLSLLEGDPDDMTHRWLLNIAYMTLGEHPEKVPPRWLIPLDAFKSQQDMTRFRDVAAQVGLDQRGLAGGVVVDDFDGDGYLDIMISGTGLHQQLRYFHNNGDGTFSDRTEQAGLTGITGGLNIVQGDYNNDGHLDLLVLRGGWQFQYGKEPLSLLRNNGDGTFDDVTAEAGLVDLRPTQTAAWADFHNHGRLDLFVAYESVTPTMVWSFAKAPKLRHLLTKTIPSFERNPCALFRNNGDGTFTNVASQAGVDAVGLIKGVAAGDYNNDGWTDIYLSQVGGDNVLFRNNGRDASGAISFTNVTKQAGVGKPEFGFPTWFFDFDNDGWLDLFAGDITDRLSELTAVIADGYLGKEKKITCLYKNNRDGTFTDVTAEYGLNKPMAPMGSNYGDLDNDGWPDFYLGTGNPNYRTLVPNRMFRNVEGKRFAEVTTAGGFGHLQKGHGVAFADINENGHQDVFLVSGGLFTGDQAICSLFENPGDNDNHWIKLKLHGVKSNRSAIGARIKITVETKDGTRDIHSTVSSGSSFGGNPLRREIGLGQAVAIRNIEIFWPASGIRQNFKDVAMDKSYVGLEGEDSLKPVELKSFKYGAGGSASIHHCCSEGACDADS